MKHFCMMNVEDPPWRTDSASFSLSLSLASLPQVLSPVEAALLPVW